MRWGPKKLRAVIKETLNVEPRRTDAYVFTNTKRNSMLVYWLVDSGEQTLQQQLIEGSFVLPVHTSGVPWARIEPKRLRSLIRR